MSVVHQGPADLIFYLDDQELAAMGVRIILVETMPQMFELTFLPDQPGSERARRVQVTLPDGRIECGAVGYSKPGRLTFAVRREPGHG